MIVVVAVLSTLALAVALPLVGVLALVLLVLAWVIRARLSTVLTTYVVVLFLISARYTVGPFAVNAAMLVAFLAGILWIGSKILPYVPIARGGNPITVILITFFCVILVNYATAHQYPLSTLQSHDIDRTTALLLSVTLVALAMVDGIRNRAHLYRLLSTLVGMGALVAAFGMIQFVTNSTFVGFLRPPGFDSLGLPPVERRAGFPRIAGTASHPIEMAIIWAVVIPIALHLARYAPTRMGRRASLVAAGMMLLALPLAGSRSGFVAAVICMLVIGSRWTFGQQARVAGGLILAMLFVTMLSPGLLGAMGELVQGKQGVGSLVDRKQARDRAFAVAGKRPLFGQGFGTYQQKQLDATIDNLWAESSIEIGWVGVGALVLLFLGGSSVALTARARTRDPAIRDLSLTLGAIPLAVAVAAWGLNIFKFPMVLGVLYVVFGCIGALFRLASRPPGTEGVVVVSGFEDHALAH